MRRNFLTRFLICLAPVLVAGLFVGLAAREELAADGTGFRKGIDLAGGTILVYEVDLERTRLQGGRSSAGDAADGLDDDDIKQLAENLKRRIDPNDLRNVMVRPVGTSRVEIILPYAKSSSGEEAATEDYVQEVKSLVAQTGQLEFRIVANRNDDGPAIDDAIR